MVDTCFSGSIMLPINGKVASLKTPLS